MNLSLFPNHTNPLQLIMGTFCDPLCQEERETLQRLVDFLGWDNPTIILVGIDGEPKDWTFTLKKGVLVNVYQRPRRFLAYAENEIADVRAYAILTERAKDALSCGFTLTEAREELIALLALDPMFKKFFARDDFPADLLHFLTELKKEISKNGK